MNADGDTPDGEAAFAVGGFHAFGRMADFTSQGKFWTVASSRLAMRGQNIVSITP